MRDVRLGWCELELGMQPGFDADEAARHFRAAEHHSAGVITNPQAPFPLKLDATLQFAYLPAFKARREKRALDDREFQDIQAIIGTLYKEAQRAPIHTLRTDGLHFGSEHHTPCLPDEARRTNLNMELGMYMLGGHAGILLYPASRRESQPSRHNSLYHSMYIVEAGHKIPMQTSLNPRRRGSATGANRHGLILKTSMRSLGKKAMVSQEFSTGADTEEDRRLGLVATGWLHDKISGKELTKQQGGVLDRMSEGLRKRIRDFISGDR